MNQGTADYMDNPDLPCDTYERLIKMLAVMFRPAEIYDVVSWEQEVPSTEFRLP